MNKKRVGIALFAGVLSIGMLSGCGDEKKDAKGGKTDLKVAIWDYSTTEYYKTMFEAFTKKNPDINIEVVEFSADEYDNTVTTQLGGKQDFDVVFTKGTPALSGLIAQGHVISLDDYIKNDSDFNKDNYLGLIDQLTMDDKVYGVPFRKDNNLLFYNKDLFDKADVPYPEDGMNMKEYHELAEKMTSGTGNDKVYGAHFHTWASNVYDLARRPEAFDQLDTDTYDNLKPYYDEVLAMQDEGAIQDYGALKSSNIHYSGVFYNQQTSMITIGTWFINNLLENVTDFNWGVCSTPNNEGMGKDNAVGGVTPVSIGAYAKHPDEAWKFISYICGEEGAEVIAKTGILPGYNSDKINQIFDDLPKTYENAPENLSNYIDVDKYVIEQRMDPKIKDIENILTEEHSEIMTKSISVDEGVKKMKERVSELQQN